MLQYLRHLGNAQTHGQRDRQYHQSAAIQNLAGDDAYSGGGYGAEHHHGGAPEHWLRDLLDEGGDARQQTQQGQHGGDKETDIAAGDPGQLNDPIVLSKHRHGEGADHGRQHGVQAVGENATLDPGHVEWAIDRLTGDIRGGSHVADSLQSGDDEDHRDRDEELPVEAEAIVQRVRQG